MLSAITFMRVPRAFARNYSSAPSPVDRKYTKSHEWVMIENGVATVGITEHAQDALGDIVYVELPDMDSVMEASDKICAIESVKAASDVYSPVQGTVVAVNETLSAEPDLINRSPYDGGWLVKLRVGPDVDESSLLSAEGYDSIKDEE